jgi:hypothetical protein
MKRSPAAGGGGAKRSKPPQTQVTTLREQHQRIQQTLEQWGDNPDLDVAMRQLLDRCPSDDDARFHRHLDQGQRREMKLWMDLHEQLLREGHLPASMQTWREGHHRVTTTEAAQTFIRLLGDSVVDRIRAILRQHHMLDDDRLERLVAPVKQKMDALVQHYVNETPQLHPEQASEAFHRLFMEFVGKDFLDYYHLRTPVLSTLPPPLGGGGGGSSSSDALARIQRQIEEMRRRLQEGLEQLQASAEFLSERHCRWHPRRFILDLGGPNPNPNDAWDVGGVRLENQGGCREISVYVLDTEWKVDGRHGQGLGSVAPSFTGSLKKTQTSQMPEEEVWFAKPHAWGRYVVIDVHTTWDEHEITAGLARVRALPPLHPVIAVKEATTELSSSGGLQHPDGQFSERHIVDLGREHQVVAVKVRNTDDTTGYRRVSLYVTDSQWIQRPGYNWKGRRGVWQIIPSRPFPRMCETRVMFRAFTTYLPIVACQRHTVRQADMATQPYTNAGYGVQTRDLTWSGELRQGSKQQYLVFDAPKRGQYLIVPMVSCVHDTAPWRRTYVPTGATRRSPAWRA